MVRSFLQTVLNGNLCDSFRENFVLFLGTVGDRMWPFVTAFRRKDTDESDIRKKPYTNQLQYF